MSTTYKKPTIGALAKAANVTVEMIRLYQRKGLCPSRTRRTALSGAMAKPMLRGCVSSNRPNGSVSVWMMSRICSGLKTAPDCTGQAARQAADELSDIRAKLVDLARMEIVLSQLVRACVANKAYSRRASGRPRHAS